MNVHGGPCIHYAGKPRPLAPSVSAKAAAVPPARRHWQVQARQGAAQQVPASSAGWPTGWSGSTQEASRIPSLTSVPSPSTAALPELVQQLQGWQAHHKPRSWLHTWAAAAAAALPHASARAVLHFLQVLANSPLSTMQGLESHPRFWMAIWSAVARCFCQPLSISARLPTGGDKQQHTNNRGMAADEDQGAACVPAAMVVQALKAIGRVRKRAGLCPRDDLILTLVRQVILQLTSHYPAHKNSASRPPNPPHEALPLASPSAPSTGPRLPTFGAAGMASPIMDLQSDVQQNRRQHTAQQEAEHMTNTLLVPLLQSIHQLGIQLPTQDAVNLAGVIKSCLPSMRRIQVSKLLAALPHLEASLPAGSASRLRGVLLQAMLDLLHRAAGMGLASAHGARNAASDAAAAPMVVHLQQAAQPQAADELIHQYAGWEHAAASQQSSNSSNSQQLGSSCELSLNDADSDEECPLEAWELSNWLFAVSRWPDGLHQPTSTWHPDVIPQATHVTSSSRSNSNRQQQQVAQQSSTLDSVSAAMPSNRVVQQLLLPMLLEVASPALLRQAAPVDLLAIADGFARLKARPSAAWLQQLVGAADSRCLTRLQPHQLVTFTRACARLGAGAVMTDAWTAKLHSLTHGCMDGLNPMQLSQLAWSVAELHKQGRYQAQQAAWQQQLSATAAAAQTGTSTDQSTGQSMGQVDYQWTEDDGQNVPLLPADWVLHWMSTSQVAFRQSGCSTLAAQGKGLASLLRLGDEQQQSRTSRANEASLQDTAGWQLVQKQLVAWCEVWCEAAQRRVHTGDGRGTTEMIQACMLLQAQLLQLPSRTVPVPTGGGISSTGRYHDRDGGVQQVSSRLHAIALAGLQHLHRITEDQPGARSMQDLADSLTAVSRMRGSVSSVVLTQHLQLVHQLAVRQQVSEQAARDLSATLLALSSLWSASDAGDSNGQLEQAVHQPTVMHKAAVGLNEATGQRTAGMAMSAASAPAVNGAQLTGTATTSAATTPAASIPGDPSSKSVQQPTMSTTTAPAVTAVGGAEAAGQAVGPMKPQLPQAVLKDQIFAILQQLARQLPAATGGAVAATYLAVARLSIQPDAELTGALLLACHRRMAAMSEAYLNQVVWALGKLGMQPAGKWLQQLQLVLFRRLQEGHGLSMQTRSTVLWAAARGDWTLHRKFIIAMVPDARELAGLPVLDLVMMGWSLAKLRLRPPPAWIMVLLMASGSETARACMALPETGSVTADEMPPWAGIPGGAMYKMHTAKDSTTTPSEPNTVSNTSLGPTTTASAEDWSPDPPTVAANFITGTVQQKQGIIGDSTSTVLQPKDAPSTSYGGEGQGSTVQSEQDSAAAQQRWAKLVVPLVMLTESLGPWQVTAPYWWWCAWAAAMQAAVPSMDLYTASEVWRALGKRSHTLTQLSGVYPTLAAALASLQQQLLAHSLQLLHQQQQHQDGDARPNFAALANMASGLARITTRPAKAGLPATVSMASLVSLLGRLFELTQPHLSHAQPQYLLMLAGAMSDLQALGLSEATHGRVAVKVPEAWKDEVARVFAARWPTLNTAAKVHARLVVRGLYGAGPDDAIPDDAVCSPLWE